MIYDWFPSIACIGDGIAELSHMITLFSILFREKYQIEISKLYAVFNNARVFQEDKISGLSLGIVSSKKKSRKQLPIEQGKKDIKSE